MPLRRQLERGHRPVAHVPVRQDDWALPQSSCRWQLQQGDWGRPTWTTRLSPDLPSAV
jgi:hypothetical protein